MLVIIAGVIFCVNVCNSRKIKSCAHIKTDIKICPEYRVIYANVFTPTDESLQNKKKKIKDQIQQSNHSKYSHLSGLISRHSPGRQAISLPCIIKMTVKINLQH